MVETNQPIPLDTTPDAYFLYDLKHQLDNVWASTRIYIENNLINLSDNQDIHMIFPNIYISNYSTTTNKELLQSLDIKTIISAIPTFNPPYSDSFEYIHIPLYDDVTENISKHFNQITTILKDKLDNNQKVLIHCMVGRSRSVSLGLAFIIYLILQDYPLNDINIVKNDSKELMEAEYKILNINKRLIIDTVNIEQKEKIKKTIEKEDLYLKTIEDKYTGLFTPQENFIIYKKSTMIKEIDDIKNNFLQQIKQQNVDKLLISINLVNILVEYVRKYRPIAEPNSHFIEELVNYTLSIIY